MTGAGPDRADRRAIGAALASWLSLAAAPAFAAMAVLTGAFGDAGMALCSSGGFPLGGMAPMYGLMSVVHLSPWLRLASGARPPEQAGRA